MAFFGVYYTKIAVIKSFLSLKKYFNISKSLRMIEMKNSDLTLFQSIIEFMRLHENFYIFISNFKRYQISEFKNTHETIKYSEDGECYHYQNRLINVDFILRNSHFSFIYKSASIENIPLRMDAEQAVVVVQNMIEFVVFMQDDVDNGVSVKDHLLMQMMLKT